MDAVLMLQRMAHDIPFAGKVFWHWYVSKYPAEFEDLPKDGEVAKMQKTAHGRYGIPGDSDVPEVQ